MKTYFSNLTDLEYVINNKKYTIKDIFDINLQYEKASKFSDDPKYYFLYDICNGEKWESISNKFYKSPQSFWILFFMNPEIEDVFYDFVLSDSELIEATHYEEENSQITQELFLNSIAKNDNKRRIKILKPKYIDEFENAVINYK